MEFYWYMLFFVVFINIMFMLFSIDRYVKNIVLMGVVDYTLIAFATFFVLFLLVAFGMVFAKLTQSTLFMTCNKGNARKLFLTTSSKSSL